VSLQSAALVPGGQPNLVANPSFEVSKPTSPPAPANWTPTSWGTSTTQFAYAQNGNTGTRSGAITVSSYTSGDAKWVFDPVTVSPQNTYVYSDYYIATVPTEVVAAFQLSNGTWSYQPLATVPASAAWTRVAYLVSPPANTTMLTVYHLIAAVGSMQIDDASLSLPQTPDMTSGVPNGSFEQVSDLNPNLPLAWSSATTGSNDATFVYETNGHTGSRSAGVTITQYTSGDGKWYFNPQPVSPGTRYLFSDYTLSSSNSFLTARLTMTDGSFQYVNLGAVPASTTWSQAEAAFLAPPNAVSATVFHGLNTTGTLQIDDASLGVLPATTLVNGVPDGNLEQAAYPGATSPAGFYPNDWGTNSATFTYGPGHSGQGVGVQVTSYTSGAAAWYFDPQPVLGGQPYLFGDWYQSTVDTDVVALVTMRDGTTNWIQLPVASASPTTWTQYSAKIYMPANAATITLYHRLMQVGSLQTDDYSLAQTVTLPFNRGIVTLTFDDCWQSTYDNALPILTAHGVPSTQFIISGFLGQQDRMTNTEVSNLMAQGHEIASHTVTHPDLTTLAAADLSTEVTDSQSTLISLGLGPIANFATPFGIYDQTVISALMPLYDSHRTVDTGYNSKDDFDRYRLKAQSILSTTLPSDVAAWADQAASDRSWLIVVYHDVVASGGDEYSSTPADLDAEISAIQARQLTFMTMAQALAELRPQVGQ
jgi:peptidoglycan/xylan/chitin deacetylase (PgdA/CDA1 family)